METQRPRDVPSGSSLLRALADLAGARRRWRIWLGVLSLAVGFALVSLASSNFLVIGRSQKHVGLKIAST
jgi:hypothetical protein